MKKIEDLERKLRTNSKNSSKPPSADSPADKGKVEPKSPKKKKRKRGAQKGHSPNVKKLIPQGEVTNLEILEPDACPSCNNSNLTKTNEPPLRNQIWDLPPVEPIVTECCRPIYECDCCGEHVCAPLPKKFSDVVFGAGVLAVVAVLTGVINTSKRKACTVINEVFNVPMSLGGLSNCEKKISEVLKNPYEEAVKEAQDQSIGHADETSWRRGNKMKGWLWLLWTQTAAVFVVAKSRSTEEAKSLLGKFSGILVTDRYGSYNFFKGVRQFCWAHLLRDFKKMSEEKGEGGKLGKELEKMGKEIVGIRMRVRDGTLKWKTFQSKSQKLIPRFEKILEKLSKLDCEYSGKAGEILKHKKHLWPFTKDQKIEPTNNIAERTIRKGVIWRLTSFGTQSDRGARYVERALTVNATCQLHKISFIAYITTACKMFMENAETPPLIQKDTDLPSRA